MFKAVKILAPLVLATGTLLAGGASAHAATGGDNCGTNGDWGYYNCMYIGGGIIRGWAHQTRLDSLPTGPVHEEVTGPKGHICNSKTVNLATTSQVIDCQISGSPVKGTYCSTVWVYNSGWSAAPGLPEYYDGGRNCLTIG
ncbi:hypothetical protein ABZX85_03695 [Streptomyces sp. NPDC004539]|uniref:hypothetical protein n=1 Tax=Streptomyces sp. NPDC004539 TaxID=3154280 RepID=UPI0033A113DA